MVRTLPIGDFSNFERLVNGSPSDPNDRRCLWGDRSLIRGFRTVMPDTRAASRLPIGKIIGESRVGCRRDGGFGGCEIYIGYARTRRWA
jgi:hypothetical protein